MLECIYNVYKVQYIWCTVYMYILYDALCIQCIYSIYTVVYCV